MSAQAQDLPQKHLLSVKDYHRMVEAGILSENLRVELIRGEIIDMAPIGSRHAATVNRLNRRFSLACGVDAIVAIQNPVVLGEDSEPRPDLTLLRPRDDFYAAHHPGLDDIFLIVEVADTTRRYDHDVKLPMYARASISEIWLVDLESSNVTRFSEPVGGTYGKSEVLPGQAAPLALPSCGISLESIFDC